MVVVIEPFAANVITSLQLGGVVLALVFGVCGQIV
jgi:hypothetical protein